MAPTAAMSPMATITKYIYLLITVRNFYIRFLLASTVLKDQTGISHLDYFVIICSEEQSWEETLEK